MTRISTKMDEIDGRFQKIFRKKITFPKIPIIRQKM